MRFPKVPGASELDALQQQALVRNALLHVERRARTLPLVFLGVMVTTGLVTSYPQDHPWAFGLCFVLVALAVLLRMWLQHQARLRESWPVERRIRSLAMGMYATASSWALFSAITLRLYGESWVVVNCYVALLFSAVATVFAYNPLLRVSAVHCLILMAPTVLWWWYWPTNVAWLVLAGTLMFALFFLPTLRRLSWEYWSNVVNICRIEHQAGELARAKSAAEQASRVKSDFLANISHELRTPLSGILGTGALLLRMRLSSEQRAHAATIQRSAEAMLRMIDELLAAARAESALVRIVREPYSPTALLGDVARLFLANAADKGLALRCHVDRGVPALCLGDEGRVRQVLANLVSNAVKFTERGAVDVRLSLPTGARGAALEFSVQDSGPGICDDDRARLFTRFAQGDLAEAEGHGGSGLGLAISRELVASMGGELALESEAGHGARFWFRIPYEEMASPPAGHEAEHFPSGHTPPPLAIPVRALIVDDDRVLRRVLRLMLERSGCLVVDAADGATALAKAVDEPFDVVFLDCQMPGLDGFEVARRLRARQSLPILGMTANTADEVRAQCVAAGMNAVLVKPLVEARLREALSAWVVAPSTSPPPSQTRVAKTSQKSITGVATSMASSV